MNIYKVKYFIAGDENCQCLHWRECPWSKSAVLSVVDVSKESNWFKHVQKIIQDYTCGDDPENHFVSCCGPDQKPSEINHLIDGIVQPFLSLRPNQSASSNLF